MSQKYADIIIDISHEALDRTFEYKIPEELIEDIEAGCQVVVPFGNGNSKRKGYVIAVKDEPGFDPDKLKSIIEISKKGIPIESKLIKLADWMKKRYGSTMINALKTVLPVRESVRSAKTKVVRKSFLVDDTPVILNEKQREIADSFYEEYSRGERNTYLLHGITGSGKTEVYIECVKKVLAQGKQAIVLIPEISLAGQTIARFKQHFKDEVADINSRLSKGERYRAIMRFKTGEASVMIGPRSALFAPCERLGLIIIDEEHDGAYKSEQTPMYHARETAIERARLEDAAVILGSATPSVESYTKAINGAYRLWELNERPEGAELSRVHVVDMREELKAGNRTIISRKLFELIDDRLKKNEQVMLFLNRRGINSALLCRSCGDTIMCPRCDVSLSLHSDKLLMCHYCGFKMLQPKECPSCKSPLLGGLGSGTQKVEEDIKRMFPDAKTLRLDKDSVVRKGAYEEILGAFKKHEADILIGTQMIVKGHDFPLVTLVGVILADVTLFDNDYMASERTFELLTQAAGRAGRKDIPGEALIQTYKPQNYVVVTAANQDYKTFYDTEISYRRLMKYPPASNMMVVLFMSEDMNTAEEAAQELALRLKEYIPKEKGTRIIGPAEATIARKNNIYRRVLYIKSEDSVLLDKLIEVTNDYRMENVTINIDINPMNMY